MTGLVIYLIASLFVACDVIISRIRFGNYMSGVPFGDWEYHEYDAPLSEYLKFIFIPAFPMIWLHYGGVKLINLIFYRD